MKGSQSVGAHCGVLLVVCAVLLMTANVLTSADTTLPGSAPNENTGLEVPPSSFDTSLNSDRSPANSEPNASEGPESTAVAASASSPSTTPQEVTPARYRAEHLGQVDSRYLREASGLALSTRSPDLAWSHNDSGYGPYVFAFDLSGKDRGRFFLKESGSSDWEDMDAFRWNNQSWLLFADTGDNTSKKPWYTLYLVAEPEISGERPLGLRQLNDVQSVRITYPTGPADTEAVAVDEVEQRIYLLTKRKRPVEVLTVPLSAFGQPEDAHEARLETHLFALPAPSLQDLIDYPRLGLALAQPNALDFSPDRTFAIVHTYGHSYRFDRGAEQTWAEAFALAPKQIVVPRMKQGEAVAIGGDNESLYYTSEGKNPPLYRLRPEVESSP